MRPIDLCATLATYCCHITHRSKITSRFLAVAKQGIQTRKCLAALRTMMRAHSNILLGQVEFIKPMSSNEKTVDCIAHGICGRSVINLKNCYIRV